MGYQPIDQAEFLHEKHLEKECSREKRLFLSWDPQFQALASMKF